MGKNKNKSNGLNSEKIKKGIDTAIEVTVKTGQFLAAAATVVAAAKTLKGQK